MDEPAALDLITTEVYGLKSSFDERRPSSTANYPNFEHESDEDVYEHFRERYACESEGEGSDASYY